MNPDSVQPPSPAIIFWSWQADSDAALNRNFIQDCLERAAKELTRSNVAVVEVDRDTKGVGGSPEIAQTILRKIRSSDVFVWDGTLVYSTPRPAPNPNVMIELGYAHAVLGDGRLVGVMNVANGRGPDDLPFDLRSRRWPIIYELDRQGLGSTAAGTGENDFQARRATVRNELMKRLAEAIAAALREPRRGAIHADVDLEAARQLWSVVDSTWLHGWYSSRSNTPQFEERDILKTFERYARDADRPEHQFEDEQLRATHAAVLAALRQYVFVAGTQMVPAPGTDERLVISAKVSDRWIDNYDERYDSQVHAVITAADGVWRTWQEYVKVLRALYPEIVKAAI